ncbi:uncharacterized protein N7458_002324 [Penicillium daleae]|uniref:BTB domain-containing protein n=1 Tax=Penicillium daleae TaxID=63821 RepID=A0AAD6CF05_9EURO|nr:uncharacterized protein N7458_002324 [Penicillium daleae]KAJ5460772.1 hypothetical protein N7458_002324 [Penicillium daleae]
MSDLFDVTHSEFVKNILPLYQGPQVTIRLVPSNTEYKVPKPLICKDSSYFAAMFESEFIEGQTKTVDMKEIEDVVSPRSMEALLQWLWHRRVRFDNKPGDQISAAIELCRLADMCNIKGLGAEMALSIKNVLIANRDADLK